MMGEGIKNLKRIFLQHDIGGYKQREHEED